MQHNNKNTIIADELNDISQKIMELDKSNISDAISEIHTFHREIEQIARKYDLATLLAIVDWVDLSTEIDDNNKFQIEALLNEEAYSNWINVVVNLLKDYNDNLRPVIHKSLTAHNWVVKPSTILLKDIALWIAAIKVEHLDNTTDTLESKDIDDTETTDNSVTDQIEDTIDSSSESIIEDQLKKAELASEDALLQVNVFEEVNKGILEKDYSALNLSDELTNNEDFSEEQAVPLMETEKSSIDDEEFEITNVNPSEIAMLDDSQLDESEKDSFEHNHSLENDSLITEISTVYDALNSICLSSIDVFQSKDSFTKQLERLTLITQNTTLESVVPVVDWAQRNLILFEDNSTSGIQQFVSSGKSWAWINNISECLQTSNKTLCLEELTSSLTYKEWLEPLEKESLESLLFGIDGILSGKENTTDSLDAEDVDQENTTEISSSETTDELESEISNDSVVDLPELLDNPILVDEIESNDLAPENEANEAEVLETSGLQMTWDDDTHPELLMVYLEETPAQIEELLPLLDKISNQTADNDEKTTAARLSHTIKGGSAVVGITALADYSSHLEELLEHSITSKLNDEMLSALPKIGNCINDTFKAVQLQGDEPKDFLPTFTLLENYTYDLDEVISIDDQAPDTINTLEIDDETLNDSIGLIASEETEENPTITLSESSEISEDYGTSLESTESNKIESLETKIKNEDLVDSNDLLSEEDSKEVAEIISDLNNHEKEVEINTNHSEATDSNSSEVAAMAGIAATALVSNNIIEELKTDTTTKTEVSLDEVETPIETFSNDIDNEIEKDVTLENELEKEELNEEISEETTPEKSGFKMTWDDDTHPELLMVYLEETPTQITELVPLMHKISENKADAEEKHTASRMAHTIKGGSAIVGLTTLSEIAYRLETLLDHSVKHQLPNDILEILPKAASCVENLFDEIQMAGEEPDEYFGIFKKLDNYVNSLDDLDDEPLELSAVALPDFILNQNNDSKPVSDVSTEETTEEVIDSSDQEATEITNNEVITENSTTELNEEITSDIEEIASDIKVDDSVESDKLKDKISESDANEITKDVEINQDDFIKEIEAQVEDSNLDVEKETETSETMVEEALIEENIVEENQTEIENSEVEETQAEIESSDVEENQTEIENAKVEETNEVEELVEVESVKLDKLKTKADVNNIVAEIDDIVMNLISLNEFADNPAEFKEKCSVELERFELMTDLSGYPELSLLSQWCQSNLNAYTRRNKKFIRFIQSNEVWSWVEHVGECLRESDDMSHMSSLSVELMREDWLEAIKMEDLQTVLLALRHLEDTGTTEIDVEETKDENVNEVISWDKDVHPELLAVYFQETPDQIDQVANLLHKISRGESTTEENKEAARIAHTIKGSSGVVGLNQLLELTHHLEDILDYSVNNDITQETADLLSEASDCMESLFETIQNKQAPPDELPSVLKSLSTFSGNLSPADKASIEHSFEDSIEEIDEVVNKVESKPVTAPTTPKVAPAETTTSSVDTNEAFIRVPIKVIDRLLNLAGELVTTSNQVSDNLAKTQETNKTIRAQDERVIAMLADLNKTIDQQEKDQQNLFSSMEKNSDFDSLEMDTYNELNSVASLLSEGILDSQEIDNTLSRQLDELSERLHSLDKLNKTFSDVILSSRMVTIDTIVPRLERIVRQTCRKTNKKAQLVVKGNSLNVDTDILNNLVDPLLHMLRNSIDHGIETPAERIKNNKDETGLIELEFSRDGNNILMSLKDDGAGINPEKIYAKAIEKNIITPDQEFSESDTIKLILQAGFSTQENVTDISGRGVGMDVVNTSIQDLNGTMGIDSKLGEGTSFNLTIPLTLITNTTLLVKVEDNLIAIPTDTIEQIMYQQADSMVKRDNDYYVSHNDVEIKTRSLGELLNWPHQLIDEKKSYNVLIIKTEDETYAIHVDGIESSREVVVKRLSPWISPAKGVIGACHLNDGGVAPVINLITVAKEAAANDALGVNHSKIQQIIRPNTKKKILVVDDSLSNRKALSLIIEKTEYDVVTAVDGLDALRVMNENNIDLVFTDLEMPRMNGLELTQSIRAWNDKKKTPIVMITSRTTNKHRELAKKAGVDDYLTKPVETETLLKSIDTWLEVKEPMEV